MTVMTATDGLIPERDPEACSVFAVVINQISQWKMSKGAHSYIHGLRLSLKPVGYGTMIAMLESFAHSMLHIVQYTHSCVFSRKDTQTYMQTAWGKLLDRRLLQTSVRVLPSVQEITSEDAD